MDPLSHLNRRQKWKWDYLGKTCLRVSCSWADTVYAISTNNQQSINQKAIMFGIGTFVYSCYELRKVGKKNELDDWFQRNYTLQIIYKLFENLNIFK